MIDLKSSSGAISVKNVREMQFDQSPIADRTLQDKEQCGTQASPL